MSIRSTVTVLLLTGSCLVIASGTASAATGHVSTYGTIPLAFEANQGQTDSRVEFLARLGDSTLFLTHAEAVITSPGEEPLRLRFHGANARATIAPIDRQSGRSNYFIGNDPSQWRRNVPQFARVKYTDIYPGIDLVFYGNGSNLEYDFVVASGADPGRIALDVLGPAPTLDGSGDLIVGRARFHKPVIYQMAASGKRAIKGVYVVSAKRSVRFGLGDYDRKHELIIDPVLSYSTYLGGNFQDVGYAIAADSAGSAYVYGYATSINFPTTTGSYEPKCKLESNGGCATTFITKMSPDGGSQVYSTFFGGSGGEFVPPGSHDIAVDSAGEVFVTGSTESKDFPTTTSAFQQSCTFEVGLGLCGGVFVSKLSADGSTLLYSTFLDGGEYEVIYGISVTPSGHAQVTGFTQSLGFPTTLNAYEPSCPAPNPPLCGQSAFLAEIDPTQSGAQSLVYSTYIGSTNAPGSVSIGNAVASDSSGDAYIAGAGFGPALNSGPGVAKFDPSKSGSASLIYNEPYQSATAAAIAADAQGDLFLCGQTSELTSFPGTGFETQPSGGPIGFVAKFGPTGAPGNFTYLGEGTALSGACTGVGLDGNGNVFVTGKTNNEPGFPAINPIQAEPIYTTSQNPYNSGFVMALDPTLVTPLYSTYFSAAYPYGIATDPAGNAYVAGFVTQGQFLPTINAFQPAIGVSMGPEVTNAFVAKISQADTPGIAFSPATLSFGSVNVGSTPSQPVILLAAGSQGLDVSSIVASANYAVTSNCPAALTGGADCTLTIAFTPTVGGNLPGTVTITDNAAGSPQTISLSGTGVATTATVSPTLLRFPAEGIGKSSAPQSVTVTNTGQATLTVTGATSSPSDYLVTNLCTAPVAPGGSCEVQVTFTPAAYGTLDGTLTITDNATVGSATVTLDGSGPDFSIADSPASGSVTPGETATAMVTLTPKTGLTGPVALTCTVPAGRGLHCSVSPSSVTLNGTGSSTAKLSVRTAAGTPAGTYKVEITGDYGDGADKHSILYTLTVE